MSMTGLNVFNSTMSPTSTLNMGGAVFRVPTKWVNQGEIQGVKSVTSKEFAEAWPTSG